MLFLMNDTVLLSACHVIPSGSKELLAGCYDIPAGCYGVAMVFPVDDDVLLSACYVCNPRWLERVNC